MCRIEMAENEQMLVWPDGEPGWAPPEKYTMIGGAWNKAADPTREYYAASREHGVARLVVAEFFAEFRWANILTPENFGFGLAK